MARAIPLIGTNINVNPCFVSIAITTNQVIECIRVESWLHEMGIIQLKLILVASSILLTWGTDTEIGIVELPVTKSG